MTLATHVESRRDLVRGLSSHLGIDAVYLGPPGFAYRIGNYTVLRDGSIEADAGDLNAIRQFLSDQGWLDEACQYVDQATKMAPKNDEYKAASGQILTGLPPASKVKRSFAGKTGWAACGCISECLCEALCESICEGC